MENFKRILPDTLKKYLFFIVFSALIVVLSIIPFILGMIYKENNPIILYRTATNNSRQEEVSTQLLENEIECTFKITSVNNLPKDAIKEEINRQGFLSYFENQTPFLDEIESVHCFDLNKNGQEEILVAIKITDLNEEKDNIIWDHIIEKANAGAPQGKYTLLIFMEKSADGKPYEILWSDEINKTYSDNGVLIKNGKKENTIKIGDYYLALDGKTIKIDIKGEFKEYADTQDMGKFLSKYALSKFGNYFIESVGEYEDNPDGTKSHEYYISASRIWKKEGNNYKFITDIPTGGNTSYGTSGDMYLAPLSSFIYGEGNDIIYMENVPGDTFCSIGLTKFDTATGKWGYPEFAELYRSCNPFVSPDGKKVAAVEDTADSIVLYDLFSEKKYEVADITQDNRELTLSQSYPAGSRGFKASAGWINNDVFYFDVFKENDSTQQSDYVETRLWRTLEKGTELIKTIDKNQEPLEEITL